MKIRTLVAVALLSLFLVTGAFAKNFVVIDPPIGAPPVGPYSAAFIDNEGVLETSTFVPLDASGKLVEGGIDAQCKRLFEIMDLYLNAVGYDANNLYSVTVIVNDYDTNFPIFNTLYVQYLKDRNVTIKPLRRPSGVEVVPAKAEIGLIFEARR